MRHLAHLALLVPRRPGQSARLTQPVLSSSIGHNSANQRADNGPVAFKPHATSNLQTLHPPPPLSTLSQQLPQDNVPPAYCLRPCEAHPCPGFHLRPAPILLRCRAPYVTPPSRWSDPTSPTRPIPTSTLPSQLLSMGLFQHEN